MCEHVATRPRCPISRIVTCEMTWIEASGQESLEEPKTYHNPLVVKFRAQADDSAQSHRFHGRLATFAQFSVSR